MNQVCMLLFVTTSYSAAVSVTLWTACGSFAVTLRGFVQNKIEMTDESACVMTTPKTIAGGGVNHVSL